MKHRLAPYIVILLILSVCIWAIYNWPRGTISTTGSFPSDGKPSASAGSTSPDVSNSDQGPSVRPKRPPLQKKDSGSTKLYQQLEADGPEVTRSVVHTVIPEGKSMVTGGYLRADGSYEFSVITPRWVDLPGAPRQILMETKVLRADPRALGKSGLQSLVTPEQKSSQNAEVWGPEDLAATFAAGEGGVTIASSPTIITQPGSGAEINMSDDESSDPDAYGIHLEATEAPGVGFELKSDLRHLK